MTRLLPKNLLGQMALLIVAALLVAQLVNFALILSERERFHLAQRVGGPALRFATLAADIAAASPARREAIVAARSRRFTRFEIGPASSVDPAARDLRLEARMLAAMREVNAPIVQIRAASARIHLPPRHDDWRPDHPRRERRLILVSAQLPDGVWLNARLVAPPEDRFFVWRLAAGTLALTVLVLGPALWAAGRIARPLRALAEATDRFDGRHAVAPLRPQGPSDVRRAIEAFNAMNRRVVDLIGEKDRMLGAIGHDLRTPLASLRIRAENVEPDPERARMIATIDDMSQTLEDILALARLGRPSEAERLVDLPALVDTVVEEFRDLGADVRFEPGARLAARVRPTLLRRAVRHLIDNAIKFAGAARVRVGTAGATLRIEVDDDGPGIAPSQLELVREAFYRIEPSRSRETGGAGLGLALAQAIAATHGGALTLTNRPEGGLRAAILLPTDGQRPATKPAD